MKTRRYTRPLLNGNFKRPLETLDEMLNRLHQDFVQWNRDNKEWLLKVHHDNPDAIRQIYRNCEELPPPPDVIIVDDPEIWIEDEVNERGNESAIDLNDFELDLND